jgi:steroid delta-isomerase-like uncharacterized protein
MTGLASQHASGSGRPVADKMIEQVLSAYGAHDAEALSALYARDAVIRIGDIEFRGRDGVARFWGGWFAAFPDVSSEIERAFVEPDRFALDWTEQGTHVRALSIGELTIPARGRSLSWRGVSIYELSGGEIVSVDYYVDRLLAAEQLMKPVAIALALWPRLTRMAARWPVLNPRRLSRPRARQMRTG